MVGVPEESPARRMVKGQKQAMNNATLAYIHENGSPINHIPARPFLRPGIKNSQSQWMKYIEQAATFAFEGKPGASDKAWNAAGTVVVNAVKKRITAGIPPPLRPRTIAARKRKHRKTRTVDPDLPPVFQGMTPLVDTAQLLNSITYVVRKAK